MHIFIFYNYILFFNLSYEAHVDSKNRVVTTAAYMCETGLDEIFDGIGEMVEGVLRLTKA